MPGFGQDIRIAELAEGADQARAQQGVVVVTGAAAVPAEPVEHRPQLCAHVGFERRPLGAVARQAVELDKGADHLVPDRAAVADVEAIDQREPGGRLGIAGQHQGPAIGEEVEAVFGEALQATSPARRGRSARIGRGSSRYRRN